MIHTWSQKYQIGWLQPPDWLPSIKPCVLFNDLQVWEELDVFHEYPYVELNIKFNSGFVN